jgi:hypothetical protein
MTENEKNLEELEVMYKKKAITDEYYAFQKKQLEDEIAKEASPSVAAPPSPSPIQQETTPPSLETSPSVAAAAPEPSLVIPRIRVSIGGKEIGAFEREEVIKKIRSGEIRSDARVFRDGMPGWVEAGELPELEKYFEAMKDYYEAEELYKEGIEYQQTAIVLKVGGNVEKAKPYWPKSMELLVKAAELGNVKAQAEIARRYNNGECEFPCDRRKAEYWWTKAAEQGDAESCYRLGSYNHILGAEVIAKEWLNKYLTLDAINGTHLYRSLAEQYLKEIAKKQGKGGGLLGGLFGKKK